MKSGYERVVKKRERDRALAARARSIQAGRLRRARNIALCWLAVSAIGVVVMWHACVWVLR